MQNDFHIEAAAIATFLHKLRFVIYVRSLAFSQGRPHFQTPFLTTEGQWVKIVHFNQAQIDTQHAI